MAEWNPRRRTVRLTHGLESADFLSAFFASEVAERGLQEHRMESWTTTEVTLGGLGAPLHRSTGHGAENVVVESDGVVLHVILANGWVNAQLAGERAEQLETAVTELRRKLPTPDPDSTHEVTVVFWTYGPHGPQPAPRRIAVPEWAEVRPNYGALTRAGLERLMSDFEPAHGGQLVLWHGKAGSGKTFALRALAWEWRRWCEFHYIVDPDSFFGQHADYLMNVLMQPTYLEVASQGWSPSPVGVEEVSVIRTSTGDGHDDEGIDRERAWRVLVLEDTGELLTPDAKSVIGQGLSRFLNVVDGLIGQGLRVLVLVTTNEEIRTLHPAVARPGRCAANVEFTALDAAEASAWRERHGLASADSRPTFLADLYAALSGYESAPSARTTGFGDPTPRRAS